MAPWWNDFYTHCSDCRTVDAVPNGGVGGKCSFVFLENMISQLSSCDWIDFLFRQFWFYTRISVLHQLFKFAVLQEGASHLERN